MQEMEFFDMFFLIIWVSYLSNANANIRSVMLQYMVNELVRP